jgi:hypothetical protein
MRNLLAIAIVLVLTVASANATNFWISSSNTSSAPPANAAAIPTLPNSGTMYVWGKVDPDKTLLNWSMIVETSAPGAINFTSVDVLNPVLGVISFPPPPKNILRYEFTNEPAPDAGNQSITNFQGFSVANTAAIGAGLGAFTSAQDPNYDAVNDSWLMAAISYSAAGAANADVYLKIGTNGLNNQGASSADTNVIFGALTDAALNGGTGREQRSATPEAIIGEGGGEECLPPRFLNDQGICIPEPSSVVLAALGVLGLACVGRKRMHA